MDDVPVVFPIRLGWESKESSSRHRAVAELGGYGSENTDHMVTEMLICGMDLCTGLLVPCQGIRA